MPRQNRPLVRDGRLQGGKKKRTDRSYLGATTPQRDEAAAPTEEQAQSAGDESLDAEAALDEPGRRGALAGAHDQMVRAGEINRPAGRLPSSARALQRQGVRRRELDVDALAERDSRYAVHELRRILILATLVFVTLIVLGVVLR